MDIREIFANNLRAYRKKAGLSQEQLGQLCGLHRTYIGGIEQKRRNVSLHNVGKIADALNISPMLLFIEFDGYGRPVFTTALNELGEDNTLPDCALAIFEDGVVEFQSITTEEIDLSTQILSNLIRLNYRDDMLLAKYNEIWPEIKRLYGLKSDL
jgi:transcriptional regulator with XRE-family HTH domain